MKERWRFSNGKLISAEEGLKFAEPVTGGSNCSCERLIQYTKLVLYIELILFLGWGSYTLWQTYDYQTEIRLLNAFHSDRGGLESPNPRKEEEPTSSPLKDFEKLIYKIKITEDGPSEEDVFSFETSNRDRAKVASTKHYDDDVSRTSPREKIKNFLESSKSKEDEEVMIDVPSISNEPKENENSKKGSAFDRVLWHIRQEMNFPPSTVDSTEEARKTVLDEASKRLYDSADEKEESNDVLEFGQTSAEMEIQRKDNNKKKEEESDSSSEDVPSSAEILNNLKKLYESIEAARRDLHLENLDEDEFFESLENSNKDETPESWQSSMLGRDNVEVPSLSDENTKSRIVFPDSSSTEESHSHNFLLYPFGGYTDRATLSSEQVQSENSDSSKETTSDSTSESWPSPFVNWKAWFNSVEENPTEESTERHTTYLETSTLPTHYEDIFSLWKNALDDVPNDDSTITSRSMENVDGEKWPVHCSIQNYKGLRVVKCSQNSDSTTDRSFDSSLSTDFKSDVASLDGYTWPFEGMAKEDDIPNDSDASNEKSNIHGWVPIDSIEKEPMETSTRSEDDSSVTSENAKVESYDYVGGWDDLYDQNHFDEYY